MTIVVCPLQSVKTAIARHRPARVLSLLSPAQAPPVPPAGVAQTVLRFHDIAEPRPGLIAPDPELVAEILAFGAAWQEPAPMLIHCWMGISRSTAAALIIACALDPARDEAAAAAELRRAAPTATPNPLMIRLADEALGCGGRLVSAVAAIGRGAEAMHGAPFTIGTRRSTR